MLNRLRYAFIKLLIPTGGMNGRPSSEFWTGPVNLIIQLLARALPEELGGKLLKPIADVLMFMLPYAAGRFISAMSNGPKV